MSHLVVIDLQHVFGDPTSPWGAPRFDEIREPTSRLVTAFGDAVTFTRFVAATEPNGAWRAYYEQWPFARVAPEDPMYDLVEPYRDRPAVTATTFGKWAELAPLVGDDIVVTGVSTDCCVISTVLPAADAGARVRVVADACAGASDETQAQALAVMGLYAPLVEIVSTADVLGAY
ncbi:MAG TPA: cysteine hydrolase [Jatrophihabitans sp.]